MTEELQVLYFYYFKNDFHRRQVNWGAITICFFYEQLTEVIADHDDVAFGRFNEVFRLFSWIMKISMNTTFLTAIEIEDLESYIDEFGTKCKKYFPAYGITRKIHKLCFPRAKFLASLVRN